jgi:hypothetical protein
MDIEKIEQYVEDLLTVSGFCKEGEEHHLWVLLRHLYTAIAMYEQMSEDEKTIIKATQKVSGLTLRAVAADMAIG